MTKKGHQKFWRIKDIFCEKVRRKSDLRNFSENLLITHSCLHHCCDVSIVMLLLWCNNCDATIAMLLLRCYYCDAAIAMLLLWCEYCDATIVRQELWYCDVTIVMLLLHVTTAMLLLRGNNYDATIVNDTIVMLFLWCYNCVITIAFPLSNVSHIGFSEISKYITILKKKFSAQPIEYSYIGIYLQKYSWTNGSSN